MALPHLRPSPRWPSPPLPPICAGEYNKCVQVCCRVVRVCCCTVARDVRLAWSGPAAARRRSVPREQRDSGTSGAYQHIGSHDPVLRPVPPPRSWSHSSAPPPPPGPCSAPSRGPCSHLRLRYGTTCCPLTPPAPAPPFEPRLTETYGATTYQLHNLLGGAVPQKKLVDSLAPDDSGAGAGAGGGSGGGRCGSGHPRLNLPAARERARARARRHTRHKRHSSAWTFLPFSFPFPCLARLTVNGQHSSRLCFGWLIAPAAPNSTPARSHPAQRPARSVTAFRFPALDPKLRPGPGPGRGSASPSPDAVLGPQPPVLDPLHPNHPAAGQAASLLLGAREGGAGGRRQDG
jgi:hypothetical protein